MKYNPFPEDDMRLPGCDALSIEDRAEDARSTATSRDIHGTVNGISFIRFQEMTGWLPGVILPTRPLRLLRSVFVL